MTLFDQAFLPNGVALHQSLVRHAGSFALWVVCPDATTADVLRRLDLPGVRVLPVAEVETDALRSVRPGRTMVEYYWTLTPFTPQAVLDRAPDAERVTYIDADMWLAASPAPLFAEFEGSGAGALLTPHAYAPQFEQSLAYGIYCVQFMPFTRRAGEPLMRWWQERCVEWCFARAEDGKFGDQKYLDDWPERFGSAAHVLEHPEWTQAPWNAPVFDARDAITYHFHRLRTSTDDRALVGLYRLPRQHIDLLYRPYLADLRTAYGLLEAVGHHPQPQSPRPPLPAWAKDWLAFRAHQGWDLSTPYTLPF